MDSITNYFLKTLVGAIILSFLVGLCIVIEYLYNTYIGFSSEQTAMLIVSGIICAVGLFFSYVLGEEVISTIKLYKMR
jgi:hypothetical protein